MSSESDNRIDYIEFTVIDLTEAKRFYTEAFGWQFTDYGPEYTSFTDGRLNGGFRVGEGGPANPLIVLYHSQLQQAYDKVVAALGRIVKEPFDFPGGRRFHFQDPNGVELAVWSES